MVFVAEGLEMYELRSSNAIEFDSERGGRNTVSADVDF